MRKTIIMIGMVIGTYAGSCIPLLWGGSLLSISSILFGGVGGFVGIYVAYKLSRGI
jgi:hypothetical protein